MFQIGKTLVSEELLNEDFVCNLNKCKGICCVEGDAGAPLNDDELTVLDDIYEDVKPYLRPEGIAVIEQEGKYTMDTDGDWVTPLVNNRECAYLVFEENGFSKCGIEKAYEDGAVDWQKPISCHLYPIRVDEYRTFTALNYHKWEICDDACTLGKELQVPIYKFVKTPLIRKYGEEFYKTLCDAADEWKIEYGS